MQQQGGILSASLNERNQTQKAVVYKYTTEFHHDNMEKGKLQAEQTSHRLGSSVVFDNNGAA